MHLRKSSRASAAPVLALLCVIVGLGATVGPVTAMAAATTPIITTLAGNGTNGYQDGPAADAEFNFEYGSIGLSYDEAGDLVIAAQGGEVVQLLANAASDPMLPGKGLTPGDVYTLAGTGQAGYSGSGVPALSSQEYGPTGTSIDSSGNLILTDGYDSVVQLLAATTSDPFLPGMTLTPGDIYTIAGNATGGDSGDGGVATSAELSVPNQAVVDKAGNLLITDSSNNDVRLVAATTSDPLMPGRTLVPGDIYTAVGIGAVGDSGNGGPAADATLGHPAPIFVDPSGNVLVGDLDSSTVRLVATTSSDALMPGVVLTPGDIYNFVGNGTDGSSGAGGPAAGAEINHPNGFLTDPSGNLLVADRDNAVVYVIAATTSDTLLPGQTLVPGDLYDAIGNGQSGYSGDGGPALEAQLGGPVGMALSPAGAIEIEDQGNSVIRQVSFATVPSNTSAPAISGNPWAGQTLTCSTGTWTDNPTAYTYEWNQNGTAISGATSSTYKVPSSDVGATLTCKVTASTGGISGTPATSAPITVVGPPANTKRPTITGTRAAGKKLTCQTGSWNNAPTSFAYQWYEDGTPLAHAAVATYTVTVPEEGISLTCRVTARNLAGSARATSLGARIPVPRVAKCPAATGTLSGTTLGRLTLGATRAHENHLYRTHSSHGWQYKEWFCLTPRGVRVGYGSPKLLTILTTAAKRRLERKVVWASTANPSYAVHGVRSGESITAAAAKLHLLPAIHIGLNYWYLSLGKESTAVLKVRNGVVEEVGIATKLLTKTEHDRRVLMLSFN